MNYESFTTFSVRIENEVAWATIDHPPVHIQGLLELANFSIQEIDE